jgi:serine/threonine protein kinase
MLRARFIVPRDDHRLRRSAAQLSLRVRDHAARNTAVVASSRMVGTQLGSYRVLSKLGEGGMGAVYVAEHLLLKRKVAVKVLLKELTSDASIKRRFMNEARATSQIVHPGIVRMWDFGEHSDGTTYILMELLEGETLRERIAKRGRLSVDHALALVKQIAEALGAAHAHRIVHRDLKPENIFLVADPAAPFGIQPKILDFGIAKILDPSMDAPQTRAGSIIGTPMYMSPEQCMAAPEIDHRADLYALGAIFFLLLCGRPPFDKGTFADLMAAHLHQPPPRPSSMVPTLPPWIDDLVLRLLAKAREQRVQSIEEFLDALQAGRESRRVSSEAATVIGTASATAAQLAHLTPPRGAKAPPVIDAVGYEWIGPRKRRSVVGPCSTAGQPKLAPGAASLISSALPPTSFRKIRPVSGCTAILNGLRSPSAQIARYLPDAAEATGLSGGREPSGLSRRSFPWRLFIAWAGVLAVWSPRAT